MITTKSKYFYFIIPTINGEINGNPYIFISKDLLKYIDEEVTIYKIDCISLSCIEVKQYDK